MQKALSFNMMQKKKGTIPVLFGLINRLLEKQNNTRMMQPHSGAILVS